MSAQLSPTNAASQLHFRFQRKADAQRSPAAPSQLSCITSGSPNGTSMALSASLALGPSTRCLTSKLPRRRGSRSGEQPDRFLAGIPKTIEKDDVQEFLSWIDTSVAMRNRVVPRPRRHTLPFRMGGGSSREPPDQGRERASARRCPDLQAKHVRPKAFAFSLLFGQQTEYRLSPYCPPLTATPSSSRTPRTSWITARWTKLPSEKMVFAKHRQEVHHRGSAIFVHSHWNRSNSKPMESSRPDVDAGTREEELTPDETACSSPPPLTQVRVQHGRPLPCILGSAIRSHGSHATLVWVPSTAHEQLCSRHVPRAILEKENRAVERFPRRLMLESEVGKPEDRELCRILAGHAVNQSPMQTRFLGKKRLGVSPHHAWFGDGKVPRPQHPRRRSQVTKAAAVRGRVVPRLRRPTRRHFSARAGEHWTPQTRPRPPHHGRTVPTSLQSALVVVLIKEKKYMSQSHLERESVRSGPQARYYYVYVYV